MFRVISFIRNYHLVKIHFYTGFCCRVSFCQIISANSWQIALLNYTKCLHPMLHPENVRVYRGKGTYCRKPHRICTILSHLARASEKAVRTPNCGLRQLEAMRYMKEWSGLFLYFGILWHSNSYIKYSFRKLWHA